jgi:hypothetical protein
LKNKSYPYLKGGSDMSDKNSQEKTKNDQEKACGICGSKTGIKVVIGLILLILGIALMIIWAKPLFDLIRGFLGLFLVMAGAVTIAVAKE